MTEPRISRIVVGALHQALADHLPLRLDFYEDYLRPMRLREGRVGAAPFFAALSFLRREDGAWDAVMARAGRHAAAWIFDGIPRVQRAWYLRMPEAWRIRHALRLVRELVAETIPGSRASGEYREGTGTLDIEKSAFCEVREPGRAPLCGFYAAALARLCQLFGVGVDVRLDACIAMGHPRCVLRIRAAPGPLHDGDTHEDRLLA